VHSGEGFALFIPTGDAKQETITEVSLSDEDEIDQAAL
jgi:hypothetical protein